MEKEKVHREKVLKTKKNIKNYKEKCESWTFFFFLTKMKNSGEESKERQQNNSV